MRKIFSSQRVETAEGVAHMLREAGIEVRLSNGRSYQSKRSGQFSYLDKGNAQNHPTVWIVHANDQARARELLREARLLDTTRRDMPYAEYAFSEQPEAAGGRSWATRIRLILLLVIGAVALFITLRHRAVRTEAPPQPPAASAPAQQAPATPAQDEEVRIRIEPGK